ncbi:hypothetical protein MTR67_052232 [Solanum verrucosum]|uniref:Uncharacterized protein n=1 Tax=Solanum verrucosum TaxID=315347 RepID=A0AAF0ZZS1_SOLVR|nr:hypothetical protein MTR67_052232 [Solanum verrucosum]
MDTNLQKGTKRAERTKNFSVPSLEGENQVGETKEHSASRRVVLRCSVGSPKVTNLRKLKTKARRRWNRSKGGSPS